MPREQGKDRSQFIHFILCIKCQLNCVFVHNFMSIKKFRVSENSSYNIDFTFKLFTNVDISFFSTALVECRKDCIHTPSPQHSYSATSPRSSPYSDNTSSASDCDSEPDQVSTRSEQPPRKKRQRTTFSQIEVWELERAYRRWPYLMSEDEEELVQKLGIPARSVKVSVAD